MSQILDVRILCTDADHAARAAATLQSACDAASLDVVSMGYDAVRDEDRDVVAWIENGYEHPEAEGPDR